MIYCVYSLESPQCGDSNENTQYTFMFKKIEKISLFCPCLEHVFMVQKLFEPLKFDCTKYPLTNDRETKHRLIIVLADLLVYVI